ncbi:prepilin-type N-terminal cleavage/methylation domain-containing protein [Erwinia amylovora]|uniref:Prepilin peptidase-dependent protein C n=4 Tax=Erwinia amylovora TaxID=552 RepID=A0A830ZTG8_ERWAM|nr:prepilin-type N-terminal cleavage/methylation domain-containing protein [Erwinia amylovora]CBX79553.1 Prepilin peptidase-dependent protein C precursor [Erwinia amylovora ATCC BAA-2158]CDK14293.1 Prepilin peptidase-dependent protein C precursor [Erwinia amylovora LA635]CDK17660.1 Prepilin peptidase-dependent protein C precursor [Erwinia amylovora LA636]CDK21029.1 Prepilin peptidase-dependent protein C precursor [Erwinia amylovora LA637]ATZ12494.1 prepilin-type cleavage/methylation domain-con
MWSSPHNQRGFSLVETLFALLLFSVSLTALMKYQQVLGQGFQQHWQQREAWRQAFQRLQGNLPVNETTGWHSQLSSRSGPAGCRLLSAQVTSPAGRQAALTQLNCQHER